MFFLWIMFFNSIQFNSIQFIDHIYNKNNIIYKAHIFTFYIVLYGRLTPYRCICLYQGIILTHHEKIMNHFFREIIRSIKFMLLDSEKEVHRMIDEGWQSSMLSKEFTTNSICTVLLSQHILYFTYYKWCETLYTHTLIQ